MLWAFTYWPEVVWCVLYTRCTEHCTLYTCCCLSVTQCARPSADVPRTVEPGRSVASGPKPGKCEEISELACCCWRLPHSENTGGGAVVQWCKCDTSVMAVGCSVTELCCPPQPRRWVTSNKDFFHPISSGRRDSSAPLFNVTLLIMRCLHFQLDHVTSCYRDWSYC